VIRCGACSEPVVSLDAACAACGWGAPRSSAYVDVVGDSAPAAGAFTPADLDRLAGVEDGSFWFRTRNVLLLQTLDAHFPAARSLLEVGCGNGYVLAAIAGLHPQMMLAGSDLSAAGLLRARERIPGAMLVRADARELPFEAEFDVVGAFDVIEHVADDGEVLAAMRRAVRPGGGILLSVPQHRWLWSEADRYSGHERRYTRGDLAAKLARAGLRLRRMTSFVTLLLPAMVLSRSWDALARRRFDPSRELAVDRRLDRVLEAVMRVEVAAIGRGIGLPFGGSLLAVAERV
jgi:SAM-dependent methyltransferase